MSDHNVRIGEIVRSFKEYPVGDVNTRMTVREVLRRERDEGWKQGHTDGLEDLYQDAKIERERLTAEHEAFVASLLADAPVAWTAEGTPREVLAKYLGTAVAVARRALGRLPLPSDYEAVAGESAEGETR